MRGGNGRAAKGIVGRLRQLGSLGPADAVMPLPGVKVGRYPHCGGKVIPIVSGLIACQGGAKKRPGGFLVYTVAVQGPGRCNAAFMNSL